MATDLAAFCRDFAAHDESSFLEILESDENYSKSKEAIHYAAVRQVWATPTFFFNDVAVAELDSSSSLDDWNRFISGLDFDGAGS